MKLALSRRGVNPRVFVGLRPEFKAELFGAGKFLCDWEFVMRLDEYCSEGSSRSFPKFGDG